MSSQTLAEVLASRAAAAPDALAFADGTVSLSYGRLRAEAEALAGGLVRLDLGRGDRVALVLPAGLDFIRAFFALQHLAAAPCAFDPGSPPETLARRAARVRPRVVLVDGPADDGLRRALKDVGLHSVALQEVPRETAALPPYPGRGEDVAFLQPTSGTSGEPRAAVILQRNVLASLHASREALGIGPRDVLVSWAPPWHDLGLVRFTLGPVYFGSPCHLVPPAIRTLPLWLETAARVRATLIGAPDFAYRLASRLVDPRGLDLSALRSATNGGEPVRQSTILAFEERFAVPGVVRPGYGLAEATLGVTTLLPGERLRVDPRGNVSCGRPLPGVEVRIAREAEDLGEILVRGPAVFSGYFEAGEASSEVLRDGWLHTGDIGRIDPDGHLYVLGRNRALLKRGGLPLAPRELEEAAQSVPGVRVAAAVGLPPAFEAASEEIVLAAEADPMTALPHLAAAVARAIEAAVGFAPDRVLVLAPRTIPRTANGKIRHRRLREELAEGDLERRGAVLFSSRR
jgi:acyl-CoA synthetase (AMP-forming)/AMP-acid ligase II